MLGVMSKNSKKCNYLFSKLHSRFTFHLEDIGNFGNETTFSWKKNSSLDTIELLWSLVQRNQSAITRKWSDVDDSNNSNLIRKLSATEFQTLHQFSDFMMHDDRLFFLQDAQIPNIAAFFAGKTFSFAICVMNNFSSLLLAFMVLFSSTTMEEKEPL